MIRTPLSHIRNQWAGFLALFLVLTGGTAMAVDGSLPGQDTVGSADIINGEVGENDLAASSVGGGKIADGSVKNADLSSGAASSNTIADGGIRGIDVKDETLTGDEIAADAVGSDEIGALADLDFEASDIFGISTASIGLDGPSAQLRIDAEAVGIRGRTVFDDSVAILDGAAVGGGVLSTDDGLSLQEDSTLDIHQASPGSVPAVPANSNLGRIYVRSSNGTLELVVRWKDGSVDVIASGPPT